MRLRYVALGLMLSVSVVFAGTGPPPFTNGSPLTSGTDGRYDAIASGTNITGVISFEIGGGIQVGGFAGNNFTIFADGQIVQGSDTVTISNNKIAGVLNGGTADTLTENGVALTLPATFIVSGSSTAGQFTAQLDQNSTTGFFSGKGNIQGAPARTDQIILIQQATLFNPATIIVQPVTIPANTMGNFNFKVRGSRQNVEPVENGSSSASASP